MRLKYTLILAAVTGLLLQAAPANAGPHRHHHHHRPAVVIHDVRVVPEVHRVHVRGYPYTYFYNPYGYYPVPSSSFYVPPPPFNPAPSVFFPGPYRPFP